MTPPDSFLYEYSIVRYVPRVDREEFVNIGLIMMCKRQRWLKGEIYLNPERLKAFDPYMDFEKLKAQTAFFMRNDIPKDDLPTEEKYRWLVAVKSAVLQTSSSHPGLILSPGEGLNPNRVLEKEFSRLFQELVL